MNIQKMMKQAQQMQEQLQGKLAELRVEGSAGGGMVVAVMDGQKNLHAIRIASEVVDPEDIEMLQDLVVAAVADASRKAEEESQGLMGDMMGGMKIPGLT